MRRDLLDFAPQIIHVSTPDFLGWEALRIARRLKAPVVASVHTRFETYLGYYGLGWLRPLAEAYLCAFYRHCDYVLTPNRPMAEEMQADGHDAKVRIWGRGVDRQLFDPGRRDREWRRGHGFADEDVVVLFFGRLVKEKGLATFADTVDFAVARDNRIRTLVVGDGPARRWFAQRLPGAIYTGELVGTELGRAVASADIMFNPSVTEAFGNVTLEAMAAGLPVVAADAPAHRALVTSRTGLLRRPDDMAAYAEAILDLAADPMKRRAMGSAGRGESTRYNWADTLDSVLEVYAEALAAKRGAWPIGEPGVAWPDATPNPLSLGVPGV
jgi:glycosyltransferase involved in cell wall biosynthesis